MTHPGPLLTPTPQAPRGGFPLAAALYGLTVAAALFSCLQPARISRVLDEPLLAVAFVVFCVLLGGVAGVLYGLTRKRRLRGLAWGVPMSILVTLALGLVVLAAPAARLGGAVLVVALTPLVFFRVFR